MIALKHQQPFLVFSMTLDSTPALNRGRLFLYDFDKGQLGRWVATSGVATMQNRGDWSKQRGGVCPGPYQCNPTFANYWMAVAPLNLGHVKGIEGNGYPMTPFSVTTIEGVKRSDLLVHRDANVPGSLGCIVLPTGEFADFEQTIARELVGHDRIKLWVQYSF